MPKFDPQYPSLFVPETPFVSTDLEKTMSYCSETINNPNNRMGNINGNKDTGWIAWEWSIPDNAPLGKYSVKMMIFNGGEEKPLMSPIEDEFEVVSPSDKINFI